MKIAAIQMNVDFASPQKNFIACKQQIINACKNDKPDVIVLPEMWNTGFYPKNLEDLADVEGQDTKNLLSELSQQHNVNIVGGSVSTKKGDHFYNTSYIFNREGHLVAEYNKIHCFSYMNEDNFFSSGDKVVSFELDGVLCGIIICYDLRFTELVRTLALSGIEILFVPAQWPLKRVNHWKILNTARAIENQMFVVAVNSCGQAEDIQFGGHSMIIDPWGDLLASALNTEPAVITHILDMQLVKSIRNTIDVFKDRKPDIYKIS